MITRKHVAEEMRNTEKVIKDDKASVNDKLSAIYKMVSVVCKVVLSVRVNSIALMKNANVKLVAPRRDATSDDNETKQEGQE